MRMSVAGRSAGGASMSAPWSGVVDESLALGLCGDGDEERQVVYIDTGIRSRGYLFRRRDELRGFYRNVPQDSVTVFGCIGLAALVLEPHLRERVELELEEIYRAARDGKRGAGGRRE